MLLVFCTHFFFLIYPICEESKDATSNCCLNNDNSIFLLGSALEEVIFLFVCFLLSSYVINKFTGYFCPCLNTFVATNCGTWFEVLSLKFFALQIVPISLGGTTAWKKIYGFGVSQWLVFRMLFWELQVKCRYSAELHHLRQESGEVFSSWRVQLSAHFQTTSHLPCIMPA